MQIMTKFTEYFSIKHPVMLAPMGAVAGGDLAATVSNAGGLGMIGVGYGDLDWLQTQLELVIQKTKQPWGVGFITWTLNQQLFDLAMRFAPDVVMLSFGDIRPWVNQIKQQSKTLICQVQNLTDAVDASQLGADFIVAQGSEAGGHGSSQRTTLSLVRAIKQRLPEQKLIAAGGIADGKTLAAALDLGADAVLMGTRFYASHQSLAHPKMKQRIIEASGDETIRTRVFDIVRDIPWPHRYTGRALTNSFIERWQDREAELTEIRASLIDEFYKAQQSADPEMAMIWAGECVDYIDNIQDAAEIVNNIITEATQR